MPLAKFCGKYLWEKIGAEHAAYWWSEKVDPFHTIGFSGFMASPIDLIKFGKLHLQQGYIDNKNIFNADWIKLATYPPEINDFTFGVGWRRLPEWKGLSSVSPHDKVLRTRNGIHHNHALIQTNFYYTAGFNGQYMSIYPDKDLILLRLGRSEENIYPCIQHLNNISKNF